MIDVLLIYPKLGSMDSMVVDLPLSIIYAAAHSVKGGYNVKAVDLRCERGDWKEKLKNFTAENAKRAENNGENKICISSLCGKLFLYVLQ